MGTMARGLPCCDVVNRGVAVWDGQVFFGALDGRLFALDAATGKKLWRPTSGGRALEMTARPDQDHGGYLYQRQHPPAKN